MGSPACELSVIVAAWNSRDDLAACLRSIMLERGVPLEVIVVDNGSSDGTARFLASNHPGVRVIANASNLGHCRAINQGLRAARGRYVLVLDADAVVHPQALERLVDFMRRSADAAVAAPRMLNPDGTVQETARSFPRVANGLFGRQTLLSRLFPNNPFSRSYLRRQSLQDREPFRVDWVSAACMIFPRELVERIGPWDEGFDGYWVDADWCSRAGKAGGLVYCVPSALVTHHEQNRAGQRKSAARIVSFHRGVHRFYRKHYTRGRLDPRALLAAAVLGGRALALLAGNLFLAPARTPAGASVASRLEDYGR
jgi:N-acetylglucosaminyl-diphospho-decaprenol L-rhamnosyltransferase